MWTRSCGGVGWAEAHMHRVAAAGMEQSCWKWKHWGSKQVATVCSEQPWGRRDFCFILRFVVHARNCTSSPIPSLRESCTEFPLWKDTFLLQVPGLCVCFLLTRQLNFRKYFLCLCHQSSEIWDDQSCIWHLIKYSSNVPSHQNSLVVCFMSWIFHYCSFPSRVHFCIVRAGCPSLIAPCDTSFLNSGSFWIIWNNYLFALWSQVKRFISLSELCFRSSSLLKLGEMCPIWAQTECPRMKSQPVKRDNF